MPRRKAKRKSRPTISLKFHPTKDADVAQWIDQQREEGVNISELLRHGLRLIMAAGAIQPTASTPLDVETLHEELQAAVDAILAGMPRVIHTSATLAMPGDDINDTGTRIPDF